MPKRFHQYRGQVERTVRRAGEFARLIMHDESELDAWAKILAPLHRDVFYIAAAFWSLEDRQGKPGFDTLTCPTCGEVFDRFCRRKYCSPKCKQKAYRRALRMRGKGIPAIRNAHLHDKRI
jgi:hypothetical protein